MHCDMNGKSVGPAPVAASHRLRLLALPIRVEYGNAEAHADIYDSTPCSRRRRQSHPMGVYSCIIHDSDWKFCEDFNYGV